MQSRRLALATTAVAFVFLAWTSPAIPIVWDEGEYLDRATRLVTWFHLIWNSSSPEGGLHAFSDDVIHKYWIFINWHEGHPAGAVIPIAIAKGLLGGVFQELTAARLGTIAVFSAVCGFLAFHIRNTFGTAAAVVSVVALLTFPRMFSEAHFATLDGQLTAWWLALWASDLLRGSDSRSLIRTGILAGLTSAAKFTGWLAWAPMAASRVITRDRRHVVGLLVIVAVGFATFLVLNPPLWHHPRSRLIVHFNLNMYRELNVPITFLGTWYDIHRSLPWYNTIAWLVLVTPLPVLILGFIGLSVCLQRRDPPYISLVLHWATLMVVRALPGVPPHDGIRLFLPAFGFWCVLAGIGGQQVWDVASRFTQTTRLVLARAAVVVVLAADAVNLARYYPQTLSHYSILVGGVRGAAAIGMEPTYWWDSLDEDVLTWLNDHTKPDERIAFSATANISLLRSWGRLRPAQAPRIVPFQWYVLQNRTGFLAESDRRLIARATPVFVKYAGHHSAGHVPPDLDVPLLLVYSFNQYRAAVEDKLP